MTKINEIVDAAWLARPSTEVAPDLLGCTLVRKLTDGTQIRGRIVETEAYTPGDPACHGYRRRTERNSAMFCAAGVSYVYLIYGMYYCLNIVTDQKDVPSAVLIRALELEFLPHEIQIQALKSNAKKAQFRIAAGPGKLCRILGIDHRLNQIALQPHQPLWLEHRHFSFQDAVEQGQISFVQTTRIGLSQGQELPWRWYIEDSPAVSRLR